MEDPVTPLSPENEQFVKDLVRASVSSVVISAYMCALNERRADDDYAKITRADVEDLRITAGEGRSYLDPLVAKLAALLPPPP